MARPEKNDVDYFPFYCKEGASTNYIDEMYGNNGFAVWVKLLRLMAKTDFHYLDLSKEKNLMNACGKCKVTEELLLAIINDLVKLEEFDKELYEHKIVYSEKFIESISDAYKKRNNDLLKKGDLIQMLVSLGTLNSDLFAEYYVSNTQSKVKESKLDNSKEKETNQQHEYEKVLLVQSEDFVNEWKRWLEYRSEIKKPYKSFSSMRLQILELKKYNDEVVIKMIDQSIRQGWQGIFDLKNVNNGGTDKIKSADFKPGGAGKL